uniref:Urease accessory protein UreH-like transmembrane domain-containing protein n=1 Tax=Oryza barthii TaxID=65489 RepID=A0A0D3GC32_9ORYZ
MAMERLISSPLLPRPPPRAAFSRPPPSLAAAPPHHRAGGAASGYGSRPPLASLLLSRHHHHHQPPVLAANPAADVAAGEAVPPATATASRRFLQKVASAAAATLLATIALTLIQPAWAPPALASFHSAAKAGGGIFKSELLSSAWTGFLAGCLHTLSGPDHLAALAPLSIGRSRVESAAVGALWGCGHDAGQVIFGLLFLSLKDRLHIEVIRTWGTGGGGGAHRGPLDALPATRKKITFATFATGIVHGLQPDALMMVLPALALPSRVAGAAFLGMFLVGTVVAMGSYTVLIGSCTEALKERVPRITEKLTWAASLVAISMGLGILISQSLGFSLY